MLLKQTPSQNKQFILICGTYFRNRGHPPIYSDSNNLSLDTSFIPNVFVQSDLDDDLSDDDDNTRDDDD